MMTVFIIVLFGLNSVFCRDLQMFSDAVTNATRFVENRTIIEADIVDENSATPGFYAVGFGQFSGNLSEGPGAPTARSGSLLDTQNIQSSDVIVESIARGNFASSGSNEAVSGNNQTIANIQNSTVSLTGVALNNAARTTGEYAIAGNFQNIGDVSNSSLSSNLCSRNNRAVTTENNNAISGNQQIFGDLVNSTLVIDLRAENNNASASQNAVAGNQVVLGDIVDSQVDLNADANYNFAYSVNGDAVSGSRVLLPQTFFGLGVRLTENNFRNRAVARNGNAIIEFLATTQTSRKLMKYNID